MGGIFICLHPRKETDLVCLGGEDTACWLIYVGSTVDVCSRWAQTKKACLDENSVNTGLYEHFRDGCPANTVNTDLAHLRWTLVDHIDVTEEQLVNAGRQGGAKCRCKECSRLKTVEDKWNCRLGSFYGSSGFNTRDEIKARSSSSKRAKPRPKMKLSMIWRRAQVQGIHMGEGG